ncbi:hypothetical protein K435DRAFT_763501 [Dendrothele bispora CBS 962.96]|uniref:S-adenosyl-L-methionine-dependent methyltransferase n=1 Tax=Dendrothele bispora (strain CBS 962.96) TaxID=1314807 RepID=A0A4S8LC94_DENBC|nr:hypothetical protein K435DRAFT_763501 [Dendrothele bispora CBS 962.96]
MNGHDNHDNTQYNGYNEEEFEPSDPSSSGEFSDSDSDSDSVSGTAGTGSDSGVVDVDDESIPSYFIERGGRLYHADTTSPYPLPCDGREIQRLNAQHSLLKNVFGRNYIRQDLVQEVLTDDGSMKVVVDFAHGTGRWAVEMGQQFPHVQFYGLEIVPITNREHLDNVQFELNSEISRGTRFDEGSVTIVHARTVYMTVRNYYQSIILEAGRILQTGGLYLAGEWGYPAFIGQEPHPNLAQMGLGQFFNSLSQCLAPRGITRLGRDLENLIRNSNLFNPIHVHNVWVPIGPWDPQRQEFGARMRRILRRFMSSTKPLLLESSGWTEAQINDLFAVCNTEMTSTPRLVMVFHAICAVRWRGE